MTRRTASIDTNCPATKAADVDLWAHSDRDDPMYPKLWRTVSPGFRPRLCVLAVQAVVSDIPSWQFGRWLALELKADLAAAVTHEERELLTAMVTYVEARLTNSLDKLANLHVCAQTLLQRARQNEHVLWLAEEW